jgi:hypothetical protein
MLTRWRPEAPSQPSSVTQRAAWAGTGWCRQALHRGRTKALEPACWPRPTAAAHGPHLAVRLAVQHSLLRLPLRVQHRHLARELRHRPLARAPLLRHLHRTAQPQPPLSATWPCFGGGARAAGWAAASARTLVSWIHGGTAMDRALHDAQCCCSAGGARYPPPLGAWLLTADPVRA